MYLDLQLRLNLYFLMVYLEVREFSGKGLKSLGPLKSTPRSVVWFTLPETNSSPLKMDGWKISFLLGWLNIERAVSFREGKFSDYHWNGISFQSWAIKSIKVEVTTWGNCWHEDVKMLKKARPLIYEATWPNMNSWKACFALQKVDILAFITENGV